MLDLAGPAAARAVQAEQGEMGGMVLAEAGDEHAERQAAAVTAALTHADPQGARGRDPQVAQTKNAVGVAAAHR